MTTTNPIVSQPVRTQDQEVNLLEQYVRNGSWLDKQVFPPLQYAVPEILPEGYSLLAGPPKAGKSWLVANIATACASGGYALKNIKVEPRPVLYFALEDGDRRLQSRFRKMSVDGIIPEKVNRALVVHSLTHLICIAEDFQDEYEQPPLIIVDTLGRVSPGRTGSQSQYEADYQLGAALQKLAHRKPGCTVLAVHHTNKGEHTDFMNAVSGTQGVTGACDVVLVLDRSRGEQDAVITISGRDIEREAEYAITLNDGCWELIGGSLDAARAKASEVRQSQRDAANDKRFGDKTQTALEALRNSITPMKAKDIAHIIDVSPDTAGKYLRRLVEAGQIEKVERGSFRYVSELSEVS